VIDGTQPLPLAPAAGNQPVFLEKRPELTEVGQVAAPGVGAQVPFRRQVRPEGLDGLFHDRIPLVDGHTPLERRG